ncbi:MAG TPA: glycosyltransferase [Rubrobacter sp.]|nr:glycosyltransferase [Rubrobacter sp.]
MRASEALTLGMKLLDSGLRTSTVDFPREVSPMIEQLLRSAYLEALKLWPAAYGRLYRASGSGYAPRYKRYVERSGVRALERLVGSSGARALVATHFYGAGVLGRYKELNPEAFAAVVLTDYVPHPIGIPPNLDVYIVADEAAANLVADFGVPENLIHPTGIPIEPAFEEPADVRGARAEILGLRLDDVEDDLPVVLVMGGGLGSGMLERTVQKLLGVSTAMHLAVLCGSNELVRSRLQRLAGRHDHKATILSFTDRVRDLMAAATVLVTKPGGMTCTEALARGLPQVLYHPIPGNEEDNAAAIVRYNAGVMVTSTRQVLGETLKILTSQRHRQRLGDAACAAHRPHSARSAARLVLDGLA